MRRALFGEHVAGEVVAPGQERHLNCQFGLARFEISPLIGRAVFKAVRRHDLDVLAKLAEPELCRVQEVGAEIGQNAGALIAPGRIAHEPRGAVAVEHATAVDRA